MQGAQPVAVHDGLLGLLRRGERGLRREGGEGVDGRVDPLDALEHHARQLDGREPLRPDQRRQLGRGGEREVRHFLEMSQWPS
ncbi:MAG TPA: hypothetical protein VFX28_17700, partial [Methylomirabilota bacterium]|nr:hypothetical protein [Methylomirabilota bacterium]